MTSILGKRSASTMGSPHRRLSTNKVEKMVCDEVVFREVYNKENVVFCVNAKALHDVCGHLMDSELKGTAIEGRNEVVTVTDLVATTKSYGEENSELQRKVNNLDAAVAALNKDIDELKKQTKKWNAFASIIMSAVKLIVEDNEGM